MNHIPAVLDVPVIILSGRGRDQDIAKALRHGRHRLHRPSRSPRPSWWRESGPLYTSGRCTSRARPWNPIRLGDLTINYVERSVTVAGDPVRLTPHRVQAALRACHQRGQAS